MQIILEKEGGFKFKAGCKFSGIKSYLRIMTKIMEESVSEELGSRQVYTDLNHYYWTPVFVYFNKLLDQHPEKVKIELYDWMRCKAWNGPHKCEWQYGNCQPRPAPTLRCNCWSGTAIRNS